jgi:hypothetical protein
MLIPQYSIRRLLALTASCAAAALVLAQAAKSAPWAVGLAACLATLIAAFGIYAGAFAGVWLFSRLTGRGRPAHNQPVAAVGGSGPTVILPSPPGAGSAPVEQA